MVYSPTIPAETGSRPAAWRHHPGPAAHRPARRAAPLASYDIAFQRSDGQVRAQRFSAPATPIFLSAFSAFARGTLITTTTGPVAVEDLVPGMKLITNERGPSPLLWVGSVTWMPETRLFDPGRPVLTRVMADSMGMGRPIVDFVAGPAARILQRAPGAGNNVLVPVQSLADGNSAIGLTPPSPVQLYHLVLYRHATITAAGLTAETYHPGPGFEARLPHEDAAAFLALFPHVRKPSDFGSLAHPRRACQDEPELPAML